MIISPTVAEQNTGACERLVPDTLLPKWQRVVDLMANLYDVPTGVITRVYPEQLEILISSNTEGNPVPQGLREDLNMNLYCETVMATREQLHIPNAREDPKWANNPELALDLVMYLGVPLIWPDGKIFGTICILDKKTRHFSAVYKDLLWQFKDIVEADLRLLAELRRREQVEAELRQSEAALQQANAGLEQRVAERTTALRQYAVALQQRAEENRQFAYVVSHDLRAPLVNLKGFAAELQAALDEVQPVLTAMLPQFSSEQQQPVQTLLEEEVPESLKFIDAAVTQMDRLISALLKLSRIERRELHPELIDMSALVTATVQKLAEPIARCQAQVTVTDLPEIVADRTAMEEMMQHVLSNAVLYLDPARPGQITVSGERDGEITTLRVQDNGRGIAAEDFEKLFAPFRRIGKSGVPGEGMGMTYVQALARQHGGQVRCESAVGVGTTIVIMLPTSVQTARERDQSLLLAAGEGDDVGAKRMPFDA